MTHRTHQLVTIYTPSDFLGNIVKIEARLIDHGRRPYAQYQAAPFVRFIPKGKRNPRSLVATSKPFILILSGHGHPDPDEMLLPSEPSATPGVTMRRGRYSSFDPRWVTDFNARINPYIAAKSGIVVADYRHTTATVSEQGAA